MPPSTSFASCKNVLDLVSNLTRDFNRESPQITWLEVSELQDRLNKFEVSLQADFGVRDTFIVSGKRAYSTTLLAESGEPLLSELSIIRFSALHKDMHDAGRCVAFELPTAAAFHIFRAVESAVHDYGVFVRSKPFTDREKRGGLGSYSNCLKEKVLSVDQRITGVIDHIASLYRNPTIHPEMHLSNSEVIGTLNIAVSVIDLVALDWKRREESAETPLSDVLPDDSNMADLEETDTTAGLLPKSTENANLKGNSDEKKRKGKVGRPGKKSTPEA